MDGNHFAEITWEAHCGRAEEVTTQVEFSATLEPDSWEVVAAPVEVLDSFDGLVRLRVMHPLPDPAPVAGFVRLRVSLGE